VKRLLKPQELADLLGVPISFVYDRTRKNATDPIPHLKVGKYIRFDPDEVQRWLLERGK
jgi:excisionase family DNA binding protein